MFNPDRAAQGSVGNNTLSAICFLSDKVCNPVCVCNIRACVCTVLQGQDNSIGATKNVSRVTIEEVLKVSFVWITGS